MRVTEEDLELYGVDELVAWYPAEGMCSLCDDPHLDTTPDECWSLAEQRKLHAQLDALLGTDACARCGTETAAGQVVWLRWATFCARCAAAAARRR